MGVAGAVNTAFPALIPTFTGMATGASNLPAIQKIAIGLGVASNPAVQVSGLAILGAGAIAGALVGGTITLVRNAAANGKRAIFESEERNGKRK